MSAIRLKRKSENNNSISKLELINRLEAIDRFEDALALLKSDDLIYEKWSAATVIKKDDKNAINLLKVLGLDPDLILGE